MKMLKDSLKYSRNFILLIAELYNLGLGVVGAVMGFKGAINFLLWFLLYVIVRFRVY